jgi:hypothetical protein
MPGEIFEFLWFVNKAGYMLLETGEGEVPEPVRAGIPGPAGDGAPDSLREREGLGDLPVDAGENGDRDTFIVPRLQEGGGSYEMNHYNPLQEHKCLFRVFAETGIAPGEILAFADSYGMMGFGRETAAAGGSPVFNRMEPLASWRDELKAMRRALWIWDMVQDDDRKGLEAYLSPLMRWVEADMATAGPREARVVARALPDVDQGELRWYRSHPESLAMYRSGNLAAAALLSVQAIVNQRLERRISPRILWDDMHQNGWSLYFVPNNLVGALWLQLSQSITQEKDYRRCRQCDKWFEIDHYTARTNRYFCSNACRSKAYRDRQIRARALFAGGMSYRTIARELGSDVETIKGWIARGRR